jgi:hypothetical protein
MAGLDFEKMAIEWTGIKDPAIARSIAALWLAVLVVFVFCIIAVWMVTADVKNLGNYVNERLSTNYTVYRSFR